MKNIAAKWIGVDFDDASVCLVQFGVGETKLIAEHLPEQIIVNGSITSPIMLSKFLKELFDKHKLHGDSISLILPENSTIFREVSMPIIPEAEVKLNLPYEFKDFIGTESTSYMYDYAVEKIVDDENGEPSMMDLLAAAASRDIVEMYTSMFRRFRKNLKLAIPREMALVNLLRRNVEDHPDMAEREYSIIDIGIASTTVYVVCGKSIRVTKVIEIGCTQIDETIADVLKIDKYLASIYRESNHDNVQDLPECISLYGRISLEVLKTINFYKYENNTSEVHEVYFTGTGENIASLKKAIVDDIGFDVCEITDIIPASCHKNDLAARCALTIGSVL